MKYRPAQYFVSELANRTPLILAIAMRGSAPNAASILMATECDDAYDKGQSRQIRSADAARRVCRRLQRPTQSAKCATQPVWRRGRMCWEHGLCGWLYLVYILNITIHWELFDFLSWLLRDIICVWHRRCTVSVLLPTTS